jgi:hypothetical protein
MSDSQTVLIEDEELQYWLENEDWYRSRYTENWLQRTPPEAAANILAPLAEKADLEPRNPWAMLVRGFVASGFSPTSAIAGQKIRIRRAGVRAALLMADLDDARALPALIRVFEPNPNWQHKYQELIENALIRFLDSDDNQAKAEPYAAHLRDLARRIWEADERHDLSPRFAEVLLSLIGTLGRFRDEETVAFLRSLAASSPANPNQQRVRDAARSSPAITQTV